MSVTADSSVGELATALARQVGAATARPLPVSARTAARDAVIDTLGVTLAGSREDAARIAVNLVRPYAGPVGARLVGTALRAAPTEAALVNGTSAHALDFDDVSPPLSGHPSAVLVPALFALAEQAEASGADLLNAFVVGFEVAARLGRALNPVHYIRGWHATATLGGPAAAAAGAALLNLDAERTAMAVAIAASLSGGLRVSFGTMVKPLHAGHAARNGVLAALLAADGFTGAAEIFETPRGFGEIFGQDPNWAVLSGAWDWDQPEILRSGIQVKPYPSCAMTHSPIDAMLALRPDLSPETIERIECFVDTQVPEVVIHSRPRTGLEAKFSLEYCLATALLDGPPGLNQFTDPAVNREVAQRLLRRVEVRTDPSWSVDRSDGRFCGRVTAHLTDGRTLSAEREFPPGSPQRPLTRAELQQKFLDCAAPVTGAERAGMALAALDSLADQERAAGVLELLATS
jgi:2-methylcitrate dehydratase PrpD